jgi:hypothetical protein
VDDDRAADVQPARLTRAARRLARLRRMSLVEIDDGFDFRGALRRVHEAARIRRARSREAQFQT